MSEFGLALFETAIGCCGIAWSARGVVAMQLPEATVRSTRDRLVRSYPAARETTPPAHVQQAIDDITALLSGMPKDLRAVEIDTDGMSDFNRRVFAIARTIPPGATLTYGEVAERLGDRNLARDVGQALGENPIPIIVPCHRVLAAGGKTGGFSGRGGVVTKLRLLEIEGAQPNGPTLFDRLPLRPPPRRRT